MSSHRDLKSGWLHRVRLVVIAISAAVAAPVVAQTQGPDLCGCRSHPNSLGAFDTRDASTWPPGTTITGAIVTLPLPPDGVLVFDSMHVEWIPQLSNLGFVEVAFQRNAANSPVTILVKGDVFVASNGALQVRGANGSAGNNAVFGVGGLGGPGGFRGGDGAFRLANAASDGGAGLGPSGGLGGTAEPLAGAGGGVFVGAEDLLPLLGGAGGGGGRSANAITSCSGGGGGGGGGALLLAANGTITINNTNGAILADGGNGGGATGSPCASGGGGGAGGAIRLLANRLTGPGRIVARGGTRADDGASASRGAIRLEALTNTVGVSSADPVASRTQAPGPIVNPFTPSVVVTSVAGQAVPQLPQGVFGVIDVQVPAPGPAAIDLETDGVPVGTNVEVTVKPRVGSPLIVQTVTLANCDGAGRCLVTLTLDLAAGTYSVEARATFQSPGQ
jgi:hypothetical protein